MSTPNPDLQTGDEPVTPSERSASVWPPQPTMGALGVEPVFVNTSGTTGPLPVEVARLKWSWGAFGLSIWWLMFHGKPTIGVGLLIISLALRFILEPISLAFALLYLPILAYQVWLGLNGHKIAWQNRSYRDLGEYFQIETAWKNWAITAFILITISTALTISLYVVKFWTAYYSKILSGRS